MSLRMIALSTLWPAAVAATNSIKSRLYFPVSRGEAVYSGKTYRKALRVMDYRPSQRMIS